MCALEYFTTPSSPSVTGPSPSTAMIECTLTDEATGMSWRATMKWFCGDMLSTAVGVTGLLAAPWRAQHFPGGRPGLRAHAARTGLSVADSARSAPEP